MESCVVERTAQLEAANQQLEAFRHSVSHDLRAPLRHILGYVEILQATGDGALDARGRKLLQTIARSATEMGQMFDALSEFTKSGRAAPHFQPVNLAQLVKEAQRGLRKETKGRAIDWQIGELPEVRGDPAMLHEVMVNLLSNAVKFTRPRSKARIAVGAKNGGSETIVFVRDNGIGFDLNGAGQLFRVFHRLHPRGEFAGTGIGLATVRRNIHRHGGRTWAEAKADGGATFYFSIPKPARANGIAEQSFRS